MSTFQLSGVDPQPFESLFARSDAQLAVAGIVRCIATSDTGFPCRVSLEDAPQGEALLLLPHMHHDVASPYRASGPIYVRRGQARKQLPAGEVPPYVTRRLISVRVYDARQMMIDAHVCAGTEVAELLARLFAQPLVAYAQLHNAGRGCFLCHVARAGD